MTLSSKTHHLGHLISCVQWCSLVGRSHLNLKLKKTHDNCLRKSFGLCAKILDSRSTKQILFLSAALEVILMLAFSNAGILSMPLQFWRNATGKQGLCFSFQKSTLFI